VDQGERWLSKKRVLSYEKHRGQLFKLYNTDSFLDPCVDLNEVGLSIEINLCHLGKRIVSYKFYLDTTCISTIMKLINEYEVTNSGLPLSVFLYVFLREDICPFLFSFFDLTPQKMECHRNVQIRTLEWEVKRNVTLVPSRIVRY